MSETESGILKFPRSWLGQEDRGLTRRLLAELPEVLNWAIAGWHRLQQRGHFVQPESGQELLETMTDLTSPMVVFVRECCQLAAQHRVLVQELFQRWQGWCLRSGREHPGTLQSFARDLHAVIPGLRVIRPREGDGRTRYYEGIALLS